MSDTDLIDREALKRTLELVTSLPGVTMPLCNADEDGGVVLEWWHEHRKLALYIGCEGPFGSYIKVWGSSLETEMESGAFEIADFQGLWEWLQKQK